MARSSCPEVPARPSPREGPFARLGRLRMYDEVYGRTGLLVPLHDGATTIQAPAGGQLRRHADVAEDGAELLDHLHVHGEDAVGWSDGGIDALILAARRPELVRRLVVWRASGMPGAGSVRVPVMTDRLVGSESLSGCRPE